MDKKKHLFHCNEGMSRAAPPSAGVQELLIALEGCALSCPGVPACPLASAPREPFRSCPCPDASRWRRHISPLCHGGIDCPTHPSPPPLPRAEAPSTITGSAALHL